MKLKRIAALAAAIMTVTLSIGATLAPTAGAAGKQAKKSKNMEAWLPQPDGGKGGGVVIPPLGGGEVTLPWADFARLLEAVKKTEDPEPPPVAYSVEKAAYECEIAADGKKASITATFDVRVMQDGWIMIPLLRGEIGVDSFETGGSPVSLVQTWGEVSAVTHGPAAFTIILVLGKSVGSESGMSTLTVDGPQAASASLACNVPGKGLEVKVEPGLVEGETEADGKVRITASLFGGSFGMKWWEAVTVPESEKKEEEVVKMYGEVHTLLRVGEGLLRGVASLDYSILKSGVREFRVIVPEDISVIDVKGTDLASWEIRDEDGKKILHAFLDYKVKDWYTLSVAWDKPMGKTSAVVEVPRLVLLDVERETGTVGVEVLTNVEVRLEKLAEMAQLDAAELTHAVMYAAEHPILLGFKYVKQPWTLVLDVKKHEDVPVLVATVDVADFTTLLTADGKLLTRVLLSMRNNMKQFLKVTLPPESELWSTYVAEKPVKPGRDEEGRILIPLEKSQGGSAMSNFAVEVVYLTRTDALGIKGERTVALCKVDLPVTHLQWSLYLPEKYKVKKFHGNVDEWEGEFQPVPEAAPADAYDVIEKAAQANVMVNQQVDMREYNEDLDLQGMITPVQSMGKGILPVKLSVPKQGNLKRFVKLLVIDEAAEVTFKYKKPFKYR